MPNFSPEQMLTSIHRAAPLAISVVVNRKIESANAYMCGMLGYREDELLGKSVDTVYANQEEYERVGENEYAVMAAKGIGAVETRWKTKTGRPIDILLSATAIDNIDISKGVTFTAADITKQKELQRENEKIVASLGSVIADRTQWLNANNLKLQSEVAKLSSTEKKLRKSKKELMQSIKQLQRTQVQIIQAEKMASIGQLAAGVAHEINNPTGFVSSNLFTMGHYQADMAKLLERYEKIVTLLTQTTELADLPEPLNQAITETRQFAEEIDLAFIRDDFTDLIKESREGTERIKRIVENLKDFAHPGAEELIETDINQGMDSTINILWNEIRFNCELAKDYGDLPWIMCNSQQINQVFLNLLLNASQSIDNKGKIEVRTRHQDDHIVVQVSDNGCGIPEDHQTQIFDPFFTTKQIGKGTGLGLTTSYSIVEKHGGKIEVESTEGEGTTFTVYLPTSPQDFNSEVADTAIEK